MKFSTAKECITPHWPVKMAGYLNRTESCEGVLQDMFVKALLLNDGKNRVLIISFDLCMVDRAFSDEIKLWVNKKYGIFEKDILIHAIHTHSGPATSHMKRYTDPERFKEIQRYMEFLKKRVTTCIDSCLNGLVQEGTMEVGMGETFIAVNRRQKTKEGISLGVNPSGRVDRSLFVAKLMNEQNKVKAVLFCCSCHPIAMSGSVLHLSPDYPGAACIEIEKSYPEAMAIFLQGACGNLNVAVKMRGKDLDEITSSAQNVLFIGRVLANDVKNVLRCGMKKIDVSLHTKLEKITLPLGETRLDDIREQTNSKQKVFSDYALWLLDKIEKGTAPKECELLLGVISFNESVRLAFAEAEVMTETAESVRERFSGGMTMLMGYSNGCVGYIPTTEMLCDGGYEADNFWKKVGYPGPLADNAEQMLIDYFGE